MTGFPHIYLIRLCISYSYDTYVRDCTRLYLYENKSNQHVLEIKQGKLNLSIILYSSENN
jgi:hypothetical protein